MRTLGDTGNASGMLNKVAFILAALLLLLPLNEGADCAVLGCVWDITCQDITRPSLGQLSWSHVRVFLVEEGQDLYFKTLITIRNTLFSHWHLKCCTICQ